MELLKIELFWPLNCMLMLNWIIWNKTVLKLTLCIAQLAGAVEYTNCTSAEGVRPPPSMSVLDMTLNNLMV